MDDVLIFVQSVSEFYEKNASEQIDYFSYFLTEVKHEKILTTKIIKELFEICKIPAYSNIASYFNSKSKRVRNRPSTYIKVKSGYNITAKKIKEIEQELKINKNYNPSKEFINIELFESTRGYLKNMATEATLCYDFGLYNACLVIVRKLIETLIIELYEKRKIENEIKDSNNEYLQLSKLIELLLKHEDWNITKNTKKSIPTVKKYADLAAHNRRFSALKPDIDNMKNDLRILLQELLSLIDY